MKKTLQLIFCRGVGCLLAGLATAGLAQTMTHTQTLHEAAASGNVAEVKRLLDKGVEVNTKDGKGRTPLILAAKGSNTLEVVKALLEKGADVNEKSNGETPLSVAANFGNLEVVRALIARGADVNATNSAIAWTPLMVAAWRKHLEVVKVLIERGADVNAADKNGWTPLTFTSKEIADLLRQHGAKE